MPVVAFLGDVRKAAGQSTVDIHTVTVAVALATVGSMIGPGFASLRVGDGTLAPNVEVLVNGRNVEFMEGLDTRPGPMDRVRIFYGGVRGFPGG